MAGVLLQLVKVACVGSLWGMVMTTFARPSYAVFAGLLVFYLLLVVFDGGVSRGGNVSG